MPELLSGQGLSLVILSVPTVRQMKLLLAKALSSSEQWPTSPDLSVQAWIYFPQCLARGKLVFRPCFSLGKMQRLSWLFPGSATSESRVNSCQGTPPSLPLSHWHSCRRGSTPVPLPLHQSLSFRVWGLPTLPTADWRAFPSIFSSLPLLWALRE